MSHLKRKKEIAIGALPPKGTNAYDKIIDHLEKKETPETKEWYKKMWKKANSSLEAQYSSECGLATESNLRHFLLEFNKRAWTSGLHSMPTMFNVMEAFFKYNKPEVYFELIEEENYYVTFFDFLDFVTSDDFVPNSKTLKDNVTPDIVFNFDIIKDFENHKFKNSNGQIFIVRGISLIRRESEITLSIITGKNKTDEDILEMDIYKDIQPANPSKEKIIEKIKEDLKKDQLEFEYLDNDKKYIKTIIAIRLDIETLTFDSTYIGVETNMMFKVTSDDKTVFVDNNGNFLSDSYKQLYFDNVNKIREYDAIIDLAKYLVYLPLYFNLNEDSIKTESIETNYKKMIQNPLKKRNFQNSIGYKTPEKSIFYTDKKDILAPNKIILRDDLFKVEKSGFWKELLPEEIGQDKKGNTIHGKTWVNQSTSWFQATEDDLIIEEDQFNFEGLNVGYIYLLRNPTIGKNIFKIGLTRKNVDVRMAQLSNTSTPDKFYKISEWKVKDCILAEKQIHEILNKYRIDPNREFFDIPHEKAISIITNTVKKINEI